MAMTARPVVYTMGTSIARKQLRDFLCLAIKYRNSLLRELENGPGDVSDASKIGFGGGSGEDTLPDRFWTDFGPHFGSHVEVKIELRWYQKSSSKKHKLPRSNWKRFGTVLTLILTGFWSA